MKKVMGDLRGMRGLKEEITRMREEIRTEIREQGWHVGRELEKMKKEIRELREREANWIEEREEINGRIEDLETRVRDGRQGREKGKSEKGREGGLEGLVEERLKEIERREERRERKERRRNIII